MAKRWSFTHMISKDELLTVFPIEDAADLPNSIQLTESEDSRDVMALLSEKKLENEKLEEEQNIQVLEPKLIQPQSNLLFEYYEKLLFESHIPLRSGTKQHQKKKKCLKIVSILFGSTAGIPFIAPAKKFAGNNRGLSIIYPSSMTVAVGVVNIWSLLNYVNSTQHSIHSDYGQNRCRRYTPFVLPILLGVGTALAGTIISLSYNDNIIYGFISFSNDVIGGTCAYNILLRKISKYFQIRKHNATVEEYLRKSLLSSLFHALEITYNMNEAELSTFLKNNFLDRNFDPGINTNQEKTALLFLRYMIKMGAQDLTKQKRKCNKLFGYAMNATSFLLPSAWFATIFRIVFNSMQGKIGIWPVSAIIGSFSTLPVYILESYLTYTILKKLSHFVGDISTHSYRKSLEIKCFFKTTLVLSSIGLTMAIFCYAGRAQVVEDQYDNSFRYFVLPTAILSTILFKLSAMLECIPKFIKQLISRYSNENNRYLNQISSIFNDFSISIENSNLKDFEEFLAQIEVESLDQEIPKESDLYKAITHYQTKKTENKLNTPRPKHSQHESDISKDKSLLYSYDIKQITNMPISDVPTRKPRKSKRCSPCKDLCHIL